MSEIAEHLSPTSPLPGEAKQDATARGTGAAARVHVGEQIRHALWAGELVPGQRLVERDIADQLGVTRNSVRDALFDLASDGLVELIPNRGARIRVISIDEAIQITECRSALERLCARKAAETITEPQRTQLKEIGALLQSAVAEGAYETYSALNRRLHDLIIEFSGQHVARRQLERLNVQMVRFQFRLAARPGRPQKSLPQLLAIVEAVTKGDPDAADAAAEAQLASVIEELSATETVNGLGMGILRTPFHAV